MATLNFPDDPTTGDVYTDGNSGFSYEWNGTVWISTDPSTVSNIREIDDISSGFDGSDTTFTLQVAGVNVEPANVQQLIISVGGVMQNAGQDFTVSGSTLTFTTAPTSGLTFFGVLLGTALSLNTVADGSVGRASLSTTTNYMMGGLTVDQSAGIITAYQFKGDGSGLTGVASTDNIKTSTDAYFGANVSIGGSLTVQGTETIINVEELNVQDKTIGIGSTSTPTAATQDGAGAIIYGQTHIDILYDVDKAALGISTGVNVSGFVTATEVNATTRLVATAATVGSGVTINNTGIDVGIGAGIITAKDYYGNASNMTGIGITADVIAADPIKGSATYSAVSPYSQISFNVNQGIKAGNADKQIDIRNGSITGPIIESFGVGSSVTYSFGQAIIQPSGIGITNQQTYFVVAPDGAFEAVGGGNSTGIINTYSFDTKDFDRKRMAMGYNAYGVFGGNGATTHDTSISSPVQVGDVSTQWRVLSADNNSSSTGMYGIKTNGTLWVWGNNGYGKFGTTFNNNRSSPTQVATDTNWKQVAAAFLSALATKTDGTLWSWGYNGQGNLGHNDTTQYSSPKQIGSGTDWKQVCASECVIGAVKTDGSLWAWGRNNQGQLGISDKTGRSSPTQIPGTDWVGVESRRGVMMMASKNATSAPGRYLDQQGELWVWGQNQYGILGLSNETAYSSPKQLPGTNWDIVGSNPGSGKYVTMHTKSDGTLWTWGWGNDGKLGHNSESPSQSPKQIPGTWSSGYNTFGQGINGASGAVNSDGKIFVWGVNNYGQLGNVNRAEVSSPTQLAGTYSNIVGGQRWFQQITKNTQ